MIRKTLLASAIAVSLGHAAFAADSTKTDTSTDMPSTTHQKTVIQPTGTDNQQNNTESQSAATDSSNQAKPESTQSQSAATDSSNQAKPESTQSQSAATDSSSQAKPESMQSQSAATDSSSQAKPESTETRTTVAIDPKKPSDSMNADRMYDFRASDLLGVEVGNNQDDDIGEVDDLIIGKDQRLYAVLSIGGFLGIGDRRVVVPYDELQITREADDPDDIEIVYNTSRSDLESSKPFSYHEGDMNWRERVKHRMGEWTDKAKDAVENITEDKTDTK